MSEHMTPVMYTDSTGYLICGGFCIAAIVLGAGLIAGTLEVMKQQTVYKHSGVEGDFEIDWGSVAIEAGYAMVVTALTLTGDGAASCGMNWYFYSRMTAATVYSIGRGLYDGDSASDIAFNTGARLILTAVFVLAGNQPMSINLIDRAGDSGVAAFVILGGLEFARQTGRTFVNNYSTSPLKEGIDLYFRFD
jgi:hypothetical protein